MHGVLGGTVPASNKRPGHLASKRGPAGQLADQMVSDDEGWFVEIVRGLLPKEAGLALHISTGFEERTCYRYAAGERKPPGYFIRALLRTEEGWQWLAAIMDGSDAAWWRDLQRARRIADALAGIE
jgi:hypothetical protein